MKTIFPAIAAFALALAFPGMAQVPAQNGGGVGLGTASQDTRPAGAETASDSYFWVAQASPPGGGGGGGALVPPAPGAKAPGAGGGYGIGYGGRSGVGGVAVGTPVPPATGGSFSSRLQSIIARAGGGPGGSGGPLLIRFSEADPGSQARLQEDMAVMALILQKAAGDAGGGGQPGRAMGVDLLFTPDGEGKRDLYLEGYGAVFLVRVPFPLIAPAAKEEGSEGGAAPDSDWERAKRELHGQPPEAPMPGSPAEPYREERVTQLKHSLLEAMKNANNIRELKAAESVTVCVIGSAGGGGGPRPAFRRPPMKTPRAPGDMQAEAAGPRSPIETVLTIRASKADIEGFANGKSDLEQFRRQAQITTYGG